MNSLANKKLCRQRSTPRCPGIKPRTTDIALATAHLLADKVFFMSMPEILKNRLSLPVIASPLFIISGPELVTAQCKAGIVGSFPALNARPQAQLGEWLTQIEQDLDQYQQANPDAKVAPYAVNQIVHQSNDRLAEDVATCVEHEVPITITSLRAPDKSMVDAIHAYGGIILSDVTNIRHAKKAVEAGVDGLILVCNGAGGHAGTLSPFALVTEVREFFDGPIALAGAISNGQAILASLALGADLAYMGTRFIATEEARAVTGYKDMLVDSKAEDIIYSNLFTGVHGNYLSKSVTAAGLDLAELPQSNKDAMNFGSGGNTEAKAWKDIWGAGQGTGSIDQILSTEQLVNQLVDEYETAKLALNSKF